ncbi:MAG: hypothetical protein OCD01_17415 [Fibrobacterales bacterium]
MMRYFILIFLAVLFNGCLTNEEMSNAHVELDTLKITYTYTEDSTAYLVDSTLFMWYVDGESTKELIETTQRPSLSITDTMYGYLYEYYKGSPCATNEYVPYKRGVLDEEVALVYCQNLGKIYIGQSFTHTIDTVFVNKLERSDTVFVNDTIIHKYGGKRDTVYSDTMVVAIDPTQSNNFYQSNAPQFIQRELLLQALDTVNEGYILFYNVQVSHFENDSARLVTENLPPCAEVIVDRLRKPSGMVPGYTDGSAMMDTWYSHENLSTVYKVVFTPDSTCAGQTYDWTLMLHNYLGLGDTVAVTTVITEFEPRNTVLN